MATLFELSRLSQFVYGDPAYVLPSGWTELSSTSGDYGFRAGAYAGAGETVVAFRGTNLTSADVSGSAGDVVADVMLAVGMNTSHFGQSEDFLDRLPGGSPSIVCGHSLGGAMAQVVGNRRGLKFATFNAPGVAVFASRNLLSEGDVGGIALRTGGAIASAFIHPVQAVSDVASTFHSNVGVNVRLSNDLVSAVGMHYGKVIILPGTSLLPQHSIDTVVSILEGSDVGQTRIESYY